jgi:dolichol-phosphate mannosyltransferase
MADAERYRLFEQKIRPDFAMAITQAPLELAIIIPTFNEIANVEPLLERLALALAGIHWEAIFVDDNSPDGTADRVRSIGLNNTNIRVIQRIGRRGLSSAVIEGMLATSAPILAVIDGDMQHDEAILPRMIETIQGGTADIAVGTRYHENGGTGDWDVKRQRISQIATGIGKRTLKANLSDPMSGYFAVSRATLMAAIPKMSGIGFKVLTDIIASLPDAPRIAEIPYTFRSRVAGESKLGALVAAQYFALIADKTIGRVVPLRLLAFLCVGALGVVVQLSALGTLLWAGLTFFTAEIIAVLTAMTSNFFVNNVFTYRDRRLRGWKMLHGLLSFYAVCAVGALANIGVGSWVNDQDGRWWLAGLAGTVVGAIWNFAASSFVTWRK